MSPAAIVIGFSKTVKLYGKTLFNEKVDVNKQSKIMGEIKTILVKNIKTQNIIK